MLAAGAAGVLTARGGVLMLDFRVLLWAEKAAAGRPEAGRSLC
jgi:hypothetical protein